MRRIHGNLSGNTVGDCVVLTANEDDRSIIGLSHLGHGMYISAVLVVRLEPVATSTQIYFERRPAISVVV